MLDADPRLHDHHHRLHPDPALLRLRRARALQPRRSTRCSASCATTVRALPADLPALHPAVRRRSTSARSSRSSCCRSSASIVVGRHPRADGHRQRRLGAAWLRAALVLVAVLALDQVTKALVRARIAVGDERRASSPAITLVHVRNRGVAFSAFEGRQRHRRPSLIALAVLALVAYFARHATRPLIWLPDRAAGWAGRSATSSTASATARSPTSSSCPRGRRSTWPTWRSRFGVLALLYVVERSERERAPAAEPEAAGTPARRLPRRAARARGRARSASSTPARCWSTAPSCASATGSPAASARRRRGGDPAVRDPRGGGPPAAVRDRLRGRAPARRRQAGRAWSCIPARGHRDGHAGAGARRAARPAARTRTRAGIVHRLDRDTSRAARRRASPTRCTARSRRRSQAREIDARVPRARRGPPAGAGGHDRRARSAATARVRTRMSTDTDEPARGASRTSRSSGRCRAHSLLRVRLETGRTHQIRVHLQAIGHPVAGDPEYGDAGRSSGSTRQFLHAARLAFTHPVTGEPLELRLAAPAGPPGRARRRRGLRAAAGRLPYTGGQSVPYPRDRGRGPARRIR